MLLLDQDGNREENWNIHFALGCHDPTCVANCFRVGESFELFSGTPINEFAKLIRRPFQILAEDVLILNRDCTYEPEVLDAVREATGIARVVSAKSDELSPLVNELTPGEVIAFRMGRPLWVRGALNSPSGPGHRGSSDESTKLRKAFQGWAVICNQIVSHSLQKGRKDKSPFVSRKYDLRFKSKELVEYVLGHHSTSHAGVSIDSAGISFVAVQSFLREPLLTKAVSALFPEVSRATSFKRKSRSPKVKPPKVVAAEGAKPRRLKKLPKNVKRKVYAPYYYSTSSEVISKEIFKDIEYFEHFNTSDKFDPLAVSAWALHILLWLRFAYSTSMFLDTGRANARKLLTEANTDRERQAVVADFSDFRNRGVLAKTANGTKTSVSDIDLMGLHEAILIAFFADIDPGPMKDHFPHSAEIQMAVFSLARWFGRLYRQRIGHLTPELAANYLTLMTDAEPQREDAHHRQLASGLATMTSFLTSAGKEAFRRAAQSAALDSLGLSVHASVVAYHDNGRKRRRRRKRLAQLPTSKMAHHLPPIVVVTTRRLLIPGDYGDGWFLKFNDLLEKPKEEDISMSYLRLGIDP